MIENFNGKYDLHIHSNFSDGSEDWKQILSYGEDLGLKYISITDHDNCDVYFHMKRPEKYFSGEIILGIELQAYLLGYSIELLGYDFNLKKMEEQIKDLFVPFEKINYEELIRLHKVCVDGGMVFDEDVLDRYDPKVDYYSTKYLHKEMRKHPENRALVDDNDSWEKENIFFKNYTSNPHSKFYIDESDLIPSAKTIVDIIHKAGGKVYIPHIFQYGENSIEILDELVNNYNIDGIECYYSTFTKEQVSYLLQYCNDHSLKISGGSDYHGSYRPDIHLGEQLKLVD